MSHTPITAAQTDVESPGDQTLFDLLRLAEADLTVRVAAIENTDGYYFTEFNRTHKAFSSGLLLSNAGADTLNAYDGDFQIRVDGATVTEKVQVTDDKHWLEGKRNTNNGRWFIELNRPVVYNTRVKPIRFETRVQFELNSDITSFWMGLYDGGMTNSRPANGVFLEWNSGTTEMRFSCSAAGTPTLGTLFAPPTSATWFTVRIVWDASGAACYIGSADETSFVLKETLTTNLPTTQQIFPASTITTTNTTADATKMDKFVFSLAGPLALSV